MASGMRATVKGKFPLQWFFYRLKKEKEGKYMYRYILTTTRNSSNKFGKCEVCGEHAAEVFVQREEKHYSFSHHGKIYEGWAVQSHT